MRVQHVMQVFQHNVGVVVSLKVRISYKDVVIESSQTAVLNLWNALLIFYLILHCPVM